MLIALTRWVRLRLRAALWRQWKTPRRRRAELIALGVRRISLGSGPMRASLGFLRRLAQELKTAGTYKAMEGAPSHAEMNQLMAADRGAETPELGTENQEPRIKN